MINSVIKALMDWTLKALLIPLTALIMDYFKMKKTIKQTNTEINSIKEAKTVKEKDEAVDNIP